MPINFNPSEQIEMIGDYLAQGVRLDGTQYINQAGAKALLRNVITHLDFRQRQSIENAFRSITPKYYFQVVKEVLDLIQEQGATYTSLPLTDSEKQGLINVLEDRIINQFGADIS